MSSISLHCTPLHSWDMALAAYPVCVPYYISSVEFNLFSYFKLIVKSLAAAVHVSSLISNCELMTSMTSIQLTMSPCNFNLLYAASSLRAVGEALLLQDKQLYLIYWLDTWISLMTPLTHD